MPKLTVEEFVATRSVPVTRLGMDASPPFEFWSYFKAIPKEDFEGHDCSEGRVRFVYQNEQGTYQHILVDSKEDEVFMVLVLDLAAKKVLGHRLFKTREPAAPEGSEAGSKMSN